MSLHTWHPLGPRKPSSCATFTLNSHWGRVVTGKKKKSLVLMSAGSLRSGPTLCDTVEGNGNPLQYSCQENPMDGGAWSRLLSMGLR